MTTVLICPDCNNKYSAFSECPECLTPLQRPSTQQHIDGDNNQAVIVGANSGSITIGQPTSQQPDTTNYIQRDTIRRLPLKNRSLWVTGTLSVLGSIASILGLIMSILTPTPGLIPAQAAPLLPLLMALGVSILIGADTLRRVKHLKLAFWTFEKDAGGQLYRTHITGTCGLCQHPVRLVKRSFNGQRKTMIECTHNPEQHLWSFDHATLGDVGEDHQHNHGNDQ